MAGTKRNELEELKALIQNARGNARAAARGEDPRKALSSSGPLAEERRSKPAVVDKDADQFGETVSGPPQSSKPKPEEHESHTIPGRPNGMKGLPTPVSYASEPWLKFFAPAEDAIVDLIKKKEGEIRSEMPRLEKLKVTLKLDKEKITVDSIEPAALRMMLEQHFNALADAVDNERIKGVSHAYTYAFEHTLMRNTSSIEAPSAEPSESASSEESINALGKDGESLIQGGKAPQFKRMCNPHLLPLEDGGYAFIIHETVDGKPVQKIFEVRAHMEKTGKEEEAAALDKELVDGFHYVIELFRAKGGKMAKIDAQALDVSGPDEFYGYPEEGITMHFSTFKGGMRSIRIDPWDGREQEEKPAPRSYKTEIATGIVAAVMAPTLYFMPEIAQYLHYAPFSEPVRIGSITLPVSQYFAWAASALAALETAIVLIGASGGDNANKTGDKK